MRLVLCMISVSDAEAWPGIQVERPSRAAMADLYQDSSPRAAPGQRER
jgi:hypothetical protein